MLTTVSFQKINAVPLILLERESLGPYKMNIIDKIQCLSWARAREKKITASQKMYAEKFEAESGPLYISVLRVIKNFLSSPKMFLSVLKAIL